MVNRRTATGAPFNDAEAITAAEALRAYTWGSAYAAKQERIKGSITDGRLADFTVLSEDPTVVDPGRIAGLEIAATFVDGVLRYSAPGLVTRRTPLRWNNSKKRGMPGLALKFRPVTAVKLSALTMPAI